jgi:non-heme chloroperoxidase
MMYEHNSPIAGAVSRAVLLALAAVAAPAPLAAAAEPTDNARLIRSRDGLPLCVYEAGNPSGPPILLVHGFSQSHGVFKLQFQSDLARDYRLLAYDLRGHGCSGKPWDAKAYTSRRIAEDMAAVIAEFRLAKPLLVGWSYGGYVTVDYVRHFGDARVAGIVLVGSNAGLPSPPTEPAAIERMKAARAASRNTTPDIETGIRNGHGFVRLMTAQPAPADMAEIMFATNQMMPAYARRAMADLQLQNDDMIPRLRVPVLLLTGDQDKSQPAPVLTEIARKLENGRLELLPGAGHAAFIDKPDEFNAALRRFAAASTIR